MVYPREFVSQNGLKGIRSVETPKNDRLVGGWPTPLKHISQWEGLSHILWKIKMVETCWNHQPVGGLNRQCSLQLGFVRCFLDKEIWHAPKMFFSDFPIDKTDLSLPYSNKNILRIHQIMDHDQGKLRVFHFFLYQEKPYELPPHNRQRHLRHLGSSPMEVQGLSSWQEWHNNFHGV